MLNVVEPGKIILTFQSIPPFSVESVFALTLAVLLAVPLILQVQQLLDNPLKSASRSCFARRDNRGAKRSHAVVMHYPASVFVDSASSSSADLQHLGSARRTISTPNLHASSDDIKKNDDGTWTSHQDDQDKMTATMKPKDLSLQQSSSFVVTNAELPIVDISAFDYDAYRHKLIEAALRKRYDDYQPPGDVVLNSIHLNTNDSTVAVRLNDRYHHSFFDFVEEYYDATKGMSKKETEYLHPLDHFLVKGTQKAETAERETETRPMSLTEDSVGQDEKSPRISFFDGTVVANSSAQKRQRSGDLDSIMKKSSRASKITPSAASTTSKRPTLPRSTVKKSATKFSRTNSSTDSVSSKRDAFSGSRKRDNGRETHSSIDGAERESMNCTTISSIDSESVRSESSKLPDDQSGRSCDSSVASKRHVSDKPRVAQPWLIGSRMSFNRKFGNVARSSTKTLETIKKSSIARRSSTKPQSNDPSARPSALASGDDARSCSFTRRSDSRNDQPIRLEVIRSETQEMTNTSPVSNSSTKKLNSGFTDRPRRSSSKFACETPTTVRIPKSIDPTLVQPPSEKPANSVRKEFPTKFARRYHSTRQRSRTVSPVLVKPAASRRELSTILSPLEFRENPAASTETNIVVGAKKDSNEHARSCGRCERKLPDGRRSTRPDANSRSMLQGKRNTLGLSRSKEEEDRARIAKLSSDLNRHRSSVGAKSLGSTVKAGSSASSKCPSSSRSQRRTIGSKGSYGPQETATGSTLSGSNKLSSIERRISKPTKCEKTEPNRLETKTVGREELKLPRRDSKAGIAMQTGLKKYIKKLKRVLSDRDNADIGELASLSLTDAILPDLESSLSVVEVQHVQTLLNMAEKKSDLMGKDLPPLMENVL